MDHKRRGRQVLGGVIFFLGCTLAVPVLRGIVFGINGNLWKNGGFGRTIWNLAGMVLFASLVAYMVFSGLRMISPKLVSAFRFGWGRIIFGSLVLWATAGSYFHGLSDGPLPVLQPTNPTQAVSMKVTEAVACLVSVYLVLAGFRAGFSQREL